MSQEDVKRKILVVDDDPHLLNLLEIRLLGEGFDVTVAPSATEALQKAISNPPNIVIADIMMPGMDGYALCEQIRKNDALQNIPFVFLSALADTQDKVKGLRLGADDYLTKPFEFHELLARIEILLDRYTRYQETFQKDDEGDDIATTGNIEDLGVIDLLQMLSFGQKTGEVYLESDGEEGFLYLMAGKLIAASYLNKQGTAALPELLSWSRGRFKVKLTDSLSVIPTIENQTDEAIFEALRELDETERIKKELNPKAIPAFSSQIGTENPVQEALLSLVDGKKTIAEILKLSPLLSLHTIEEIKKLLASGALKLEGAIAVAGQAGEKQESWEEAAQGWEPELPAQPVTPSATPPVTSPSTPPVTPVTQPTSLQTPPSSSVPPSETSPSITPSGPASAPSESPSLTSPKSSTASPSQLDESTENAKAVSKTVAASTEPKVFNFIVIGTDRDSRNTFIHVISNEKNPEQGGEKVLNFGKLTAANYEVNFYGFPGAKRFAPLWQTFVAKVNGIIILANPACEEEVENARFALSLLKPRITGPAVLISTNPTVPEIPLGKEGKDVQLSVCLPSDKIKAETIIKELLTKISR